MKMVEGIKEHREVSILGQTYIKARKLGGVGLEEGTASWGFSVWLSSVGQS